MLIRNEKKKMAKNGEKIFINTILASRFGESEVIFVVFTILIGI